MNTLQWMARLNAEKIQMLAVACGWPPACLTLRPEGGSWCALEVLDHVVRVESGITEIVKAGMNEPHPVGVRDRLGFLMLERVFLSRRRVKVPASAAVVLPGPSLELEEIVARWDSVRQTLLQVATESAGVRGGVFRHPVSGWMTLDQLLRFFYAHIIHHGYQLERIRPSLPQAT